MFERIAFLVAAAVLVLGSVVVAGPPAHAVSSSFSACFPSGSGTPPPGLVNLTVEVTGAPPASVVQGVPFDVPTTVELRNPNAAALDTSGVSLGGFIPDGASAFRAGFQSPGPISIPAGGSARFSGVLQYVSTAPGGTVLEFRPGSVHFRFAPGLSVGCNIENPTSFGSTVVTDAPGYRFSCAVLGITIEQTIDVVGVAPASVPMGSAFSLTDVVTRSSSPIATTVQSTTFTLMSSANATPTSSLSNTTPGPFTVPAGVPVASAPMSFDFVASGPVGSVVEFRPGSIVTVTDFGPVNCTVMPGEPPIATTEIRAPATDRVAAIVLDPKAGVVYAHHAHLSSGDYAFTRNANGTLTSLRGAGAFVGPAGGGANLRVDYSRPGTRLRLTDPAAGVDLRAASFVPVLSPEGRDVAVGVAFARYAGRPVLVIWVVVDASAT